MVLTLNNKYQEKSLEQLIEGRISYQKPFDFSKNNLEKSKLKKLKNKGVKNNLGVGSKNFEHKIVNYMQKDQRGLPVSKITIGDVFVSVDEFYPPADTSKMTQEQRREEETRVGNLSSYQLYKHYLKQAKK